MRQRLNIGHFQDLQALLGLIAHSGLHGFREYKEICRRIRDGAPIDDNEVARAIFDCPDHFASTFAGTLSDKLVITETVVAADVPNVSTADAAMQFAVGVVEAIAGVTAIASMSQALSTGTATIDCTALTHRGISVSFSGKSLKYLALNNPSANVITAAKGASNGLDFLSGSNTKIGVNPNDYHTFKLTASPAVGGSAKNIDLAGTGSQTLSVLAAAG